MNGRRPFRANSIRRPDCDTPECRRRAGADDVARFCADAAEAMRTAAFEVVRIAGAKHAPLAIDGDFEPAADDDAALLAVMHQRDAPGVAARTVALLQDL